MPNLPLITFYTLKRVQTTYLNYSVQVLGTINKRGPFPDVDVEKLLGLGLGKPGKCNIEFQLHTHGTEK